MSCLPNIGNTPLPLSQMIKIARKIDLSPKFPLNDGRVVHFDGVPRAGSRVGELYSTLGLGSPSVHQNGIDLTTLFMIVFGQTHSINTKWIGKLSWFNDPRPESFPDDPCIEVLDWVNGIRISENSSSIQNFNSPPSPITRRIC